MKPPKRMIFDLPDYVMLAIRLRGVKNNMTTGQVVAEAMRVAFPKEIEEAFLEVAKPEESKS